MGTRGRRLGKENFSMKWIRERGGVAVSIHVSILTSQHGGTSWNAQMPGSVSLFDL